MIDVLLIVCTSPLEIYSVEAELTNSEPTSGSSFNELDVNLNELVPVLNLKDGGGTANGSLKKNDPYTSPKVSATNLTFDTVACALLVCPSKVTFPVVGIYPYMNPFASSSIELISTFNTVEMLNKLSLKKMLYHMDWH